MLIAAHRRTVKLAIAVPGIDLAFRVMDFWDRIDSWLSMVLSLF